VSLQDYSSLLSRAPTRFTLPHRANGSVAVQESK
jgi:hypothetical protein